MHTSIGRKLTTSRQRSIAAALIGATTIALDFALVVTEQFALLTEARCVMILLAFAALVGLTEGDLSSLGLRLRPAQGWWYWVRMTLWIGIAVGACVVIGLGLWILSGRELPLPLTPPGDICLRLFEMCVAAPVIEEAMYRFVLCVPLAALVGPWKTIVASGVVFGLLHVAYGTASPENLVGGLFLAWAYFKSESISLPVLLHSLGNMVALGSQVAGWYWMNGSG
jgi:membrane protease YdiL (CAAX protease family)